MARELASQSDVVPSALIEALSFTIERDKERLGERVDDLNFEIQELVSRRRAEAEEFDSQIYSLTESVKVFNEEIQERDKEVSGNLICHSMQSQRYSERNMTFISTF